LLRSAARVVWMSRAEMNRSVSAFGLNTDRMRVDRVPWPGRDPSRTDDGTWIAAGRSARDWSTLQAAAMTVESPGFVAGPAQPLSPPRVASVRWVSGETLDERILSSAFHVTALEPVPYGCGQSFVMRCLIAGKPGVATDLDVLDEHLPDGAILRVPPRDPSALADAMRRLASDFELRRRMGRIGHAATLDATFPRFALRMLALSREVREDSR